MSTTTTPTPPPRSPSPSPSLDMDAFMVLADDHDEKQAFADDHWITPISNHTERIASLEASVLQAFSCCEAVFPDFHALVDHWEITHAGCAPPPPPPLKWQSLPPVTIPSPISYPPSLSPSSTDSEASSTPSSPGSSNKSLSPPPPSAGCGLGPSYTNGHTPTLVYTPLTPSLPVDPADPYPDPEILSHDQWPYTWDYNINMAASVLGGCSGGVSESMDVIMSESASSSTSDAEMDTSDSDSKAHIQAQFMAVAMSKTKTKIKTKVLSSSTKKSTLFKSNKSRSSSSSLSTISNLKIARASPTSSSPSSETTSSFSAPSSSSTTTTKTKPRLVDSHHHHPRRREKAYRCPNARCTKSYLNPNGLKYHLEKGTCVFDDSDDGDSGSSSGPGAPGVETELTASSSTSWMQGRRYGVAIAIRSAPAATSTSTCGSSSSSSSHGQASMSTHPQTQRQPALTTNGPSVGGAVNGVEDSDSPSFESVSRKQLQGSAVYGSSELAASSSSSIGPSTSTSPPTTSAPAPNTNQTSGSSLSSSIRPSTQTPTPTPTSTSANWKQAPSTTAPVHAPVYPYAQYPYGHPVAVVPVAASMSGSALDDVEDEGCVSSPVPQATPRRVGMALGMFATGALGASNSARSQ